MKINQRIKILLIPSLLAVYMACSKDPSIPLLPQEMDVLNKELILKEIPFKYTSEALPSFFTNQFITIQNNTPNNNPVTNWGATLGRVLFYDKKLSLNHKLSCASCHAQQFGFTDTARLSIGYQGGFTGRHSMSLINAVYYTNGRFFWDERAASLEEQVLKPIQDSVEMGMRLDSLVTRLQKTPHYPILFKNAFGNQEINSDKISKALAQFVRSMISYRSKYDVGRASANSNLENFNNFSAEENRGKKIFMTHTKVNCSGCHNTDVFIMDNPRNNGITMNNPDAGIYKHTQNLMDIGKFKAPSLKNIFLRKRYMHDGSFEGLASVINHYNNSILPNSNLDPHLLDLSTGKPYQMNLSNSDINDLITFLATLTDEELIKDEKFNTPFR